jgi:hypothetical protein
VSHSLAAAFFALGLLGSAAAQSLPTTILPGELDMPVLDGSQHADCAIPADRFDEPVLTACVTLPRAGSDAIQHAYIAALQQRGWRSAGGAANLIEFEQPIEGGECSRRLGLVGMPHGTSEQIEALQARRLSMDDFETLAFWFVLRQSPVCGDARRAREATTEPAAERARSRNTAPFAPTGEEGEGVILPGLVDVAVMNGSFLAENCTEFPPRLWRMAHLNVQCVATARLADTRWDDRYHAAVLDAGWRLREQEGGMREYTRRTEAGCTQELSLVPNAIVSRPEAREGRRIVDRSAITHRVLFFMLYPERCPRESRE